MQHQNPLRHIQRLLSEWRNKRGADETLLVLADALGVRGITIDETSRPKLVNMVSRRCRILYDSIEYTKTKFSKKDLESITYEPPLRKVQDIFSVARLAPQWSGSSTHLITDETISSIGMLADFIKNDVTCISEEQRKEISESVDAIANHLSRTLDEDLYEILLSYVVDMREVLDLSNYVPVKHIAHKGFAVLGPLAVDPTWRSYLSGAPIENGESLDIIKNKIWEITEKLATIYGAAEGIHVIGEQALKLINHGL